MVATSTSICLAVLGLSATVAADAITRHEIRRNRAKWSKPLPEHPKYPSQYYREQLVDHFGKNDTRIWSQRYVANFDNYRAGGPIFLSIGGEGPLDANHVMNQMILPWMAEKTNGAVIALEHRFYGQSQPFDSLAVAHLEYLTSRQALHDLAQFQRWFTDKHSLTSSPFFCVGGSYPGNLATWYRLEFPHMTAGCWAASAPVQAVEDWPGYGQMVWRALSTTATGAIDESVPVKLYAGYERLAALIHDPTPDTLQWLHREFGLCPGSLAAEEDRDSFEGLLSTAVSGVMQYNNTGETKLAAVRKIVSEASSPLAAALAVSKLLNLTHGDGSSGCSDQSISALYRSMADDTLPKSGNGNAGRTWTWQTCNEFGYFQKATASIDKPTMYTRGVSSVSQFQEICTHLFGISPNRIGMNIARTNEYYGAKSPRGLTHLFVTNGALDAWSLLGMQSNPGVDNEVHILMVELGSHCVGLYVPEAGDVPGAQQARETFLELVQRWSAEAGAAKANDLVAATGTSDGSAPTLFA